MGSLFGKLNFLVFDIGSAAVKVIELDREGSGTVLHHGYESLPEGLFQDGRVQDKTVLVAYLKRLLGRFRGRLWGRKVALSLGGQSVIIKRVMFVNREDADMPEIIESEAEQHFQHNLDEINFSWQLYEYSPDQPQRPVLLVGAKRELIDEKVSVLSSAGLSIGLIDCDALALCNMLQFCKGRPPGLSLLINCGAASTQVIFLGDGQFLYTRDLPIGGIQYSRSIAEYTKLSFADAERLKLLIGNLAPERRGEILKVLTDQHEQFAAELQMTIDFFNRDVTAKYPKVAAVYLCGGAAITPGLVEKLQQNLQVPTEILNPCAPCRGNLPPLPLSPAFAVAMGLGLRSWGDHL